MKKTVVCQMALGRTRVSGYTLYNPDSLAFEEFTPLEVKRLIRTEGVNGLVLRQRPVRLSLMRKVSISVICRSSLV